VSGDLQLESSETFAPELLPIPRLSFCLRCLRIQISGLIASVRSRSSGAICESRLRLADCHRSLGVNCFARSTACPASRTRSSSFMTPSVPSRSLTALLSKVIATVIFQDYDQDEAAKVLRCARRTICRLFRLAVDQITETFLKGAAEPAAGSACGKLLSSGSERRF
jgi:hypothetical protein